MGPYDDNGLTDPRDNGRSPAPDPRQSSPGVSNSRFKSGLKSAGRSLSSSGSEMMSEARSEGIRPVQYRNGGRVRKTGPAVVHKGERVIPRSKVKRVDKMMRSAKMRFKNRGRSRS